MEKNNDETVLISMGRIMDKMDFDNPEHLKYIVEKLNGNKSFQSSAYGRRFLDKVNKLLKNRTSDNVTQVNELISKSDKKTEDFFRDVDDTLLRMASQKTSRSIQRLTWVILSISLINLVVTFFMAMYIWRLNLG